MAHQKSQVIQVQPISPPSHGSPSFSHQSSLTRFSNTQSSSLTPGFQFLSYWKFLIAASGRPFSVLPYQRRIPQIPIIFHAINLFIFLIISATILSSLFMYLSLLPPKGAHVSCLLLYPHSSKASVSLQIINNQLNEQTLLRNLESLKWFNYP